ncbi:hypothetical protein [Natranaeroarchaeum sulfidigenes]|nr:hypothetical protein [Natranaeroarchaeum sulfidigenes]
MTESPITDEDEATGRPERVRLFARRFRAEYDELYEKLANE